MNFWYQVPTDDWQLNADDVLKQSQRLKYRAYNVPRDTAKWEIVFYRLSPGPQINHHLVKN